MLSVFFLIINDTVLCTFIRGMNVPTVDYNDGQLRQLVSQLYFQRSGNVIFLSFNITRKTGAITTSVRDSITGTIHLRISKMAK